MVNHLALCFYLDRKEGNAAYEVDRLVSLSIDQ